MALVPLGTESRLVFPGISFGATSVPDFHKWYNTCIQHFKIRFFVDDICIYIEVGDHDLSAIQLNTDLQHIQEWADRWLVTFSSPKTKDLLISNEQPQPHLPIYLNNQEILPVQSQSHLGVRISNNLTWRRHVDDIARKAHRCLGILRPLKFKLDIASL